MTQHVGMAWRAGFAPARKVKAPYSRRARCRRSGFIFSSAKRRTASSIVATAMVVKYRPSSIFDIAGFFSTLNGLSQRYGAPR
jgi:hypothetical protein